MIIVNSFKPKSIDELNAAFEQKLTEIKLEREKEIAQDDFLSEEQKEFYKVNDDEPEETEPEVEPEETEIQPEYLEEEAEDIPEEEDVEEIEEEPEDTAESDEIEEPEEAAEAPTDENTQSEEPEEVNELFEAERLAQQEAELYEANSLANEENEEETDEQTEDLTENEAAFEDAEDTEEAFEEEAEEKREAPVFYFKENAQDLSADENDTVSEPEETAEEQPVFAPKKELEEVKLTRTKDVKAEKRKNKKNKNNEEKEAKVKTPKNHKTAKTVLNTLISLLVIACVIVNGLIFMADMPKRFIANTGVTICEHTIEGSNVNSGSLLFTKKAQTAEDNKIVVALTKDKKTVVDFKQNIPEDAEIYSKTVKLVPKVGGAIKLVRNYWLESGLVELAVLLVLLIARVAVSDKKEKPETKKKNISSEMKVHTYKTVCTFL